MVRHKFMKNFGALGSQKHLIAAKKQVGAGACKGRANRCLCFVDFLAVFFWFWTRAHALAAFRFLDEETMRQSKTQSTNGSNGVLDGQNF